MGNIVLTLLAIYLGLSILAGLGWTAFWIYMLKKGQKNINEEKSDINL